MTSDRCCIDGFGPLPLERPASVDALGDLVRQAARDGAALYPLGGSTTAELGLPPSRPGLAVDMRQLDAVEEFAARDMTITVGAGITIARLKELVAGEHLRLPIDVARAAEATLGGILAANISGPRRYGFGTLRDYVIGITAMNDEGREFKAGGRVVKNVAGYDLCKLLVGSLGTLGIITRVTLKLRPVADEEALLSLPVGEAELATVLDRLHSSRTRPVIVDLLNRSAALEVFRAAGTVVAPDTVWTLLIGFEGNAEAVNWQVQQLVKELGTTGKLEARVGFTSQPLTQALIEWPLTAADAISFRASVLPSEVAAFCRAASTSAGQLRAHAGNGIVEGRWGADLTREDAARMLAAWRSAVGQGSVVVTRCPPAWKADLDVWGPPPDGLWLMRAVKEKFDPRRLFNPGRFIAGI